MDAEDTSSDVQQDFDVTDAAMDLSEEPGKDVGGGEAVGARSPPIHHQERLKWIQNNHEGQTSSL